MFLLVLMGLSALAGVFILISEKLELGDRTYAEGRHARIIGMLLMLPIVYTFLTVIAYAVIQMVTDLFIPAETSGTMNTLQHVVTFVSIFAAMVYTFAHRGEEEYVA